MKHETLWLLVSVVSLNLAGAQMGRAETPPSIVGEWLRQSKSPVFIFEADGTVRIDAQPKSMTGKYRVDYTKSPHHLDLSEIEPRDETLKEGLSGIFQFESDGRLKFELVPGKVSQRPPQFTENADLAVRIGGTATETSSIVGKWQKVVPIKETYTFTSDGKVRTFFRYRDDQPHIKEYKYRVDYNTSPYRIDFYQTSEALFRGIIAFDGNASMKLEGDFTLNESERPKQFSTEAEILSRSQ